jgi:hypothetical protein
MVWISQNEVAISIPLGGTSTPHPNTKFASEIDEFCTMQTLYLQDRFGPWDEFYHEHTQVRNSFISE